MAEISTKELSQRFASLLTNELNSRKKKNDAFEILDEHKESIREARRLKVSHTKIAKFLNDAGVKATTEVVRLFCHKVLEETPRKRKKTRKSRQVKAVSRPVQKEVKAAGSKTKSNFRVAGDDL